MRKMIFWLGLCGVMASAPGTAASLVDWHVVLESAAARQHLADRHRADVERSTAEQQRARGLLAGSPVVDGLYRSDRALSNQGAGEMQFGVRLPLRRPGQTDASAHLAEQTALDAESRVRASRLALLGQLRSLAWECRLADNRLHAAQIRHRALDQQWRKVESQVKQGEAAAIDAQILQTRVLEAAAILEAEKAGSQAVQARWQALTGLSSLPVDLGQTLLPASMSEIRDENQLVHQQPLLAQLADQVSLTSAALAATRVEGSGAPELGVFVKRDRSDRQTPWDNSLQVSVSLPIGGAVYRGPQLAELNQQKTAAQLNLVQTTQQIWGDILDLRSRTAAWPARLALLDQRAALADTVLAKQERARRLGEIDWLTWLIAEREAADARLVASEAHLLAARDASLLKQAYGLMPISRPASGVRP